MKHHFLCSIICLLHFFTLHAQTCEKNFIEKLKDLWPQQITQFNNQIRLLNKEPMRTNFDSIAIIYVPQLLYYKKIKTGTTIKREDYFCTVNYKSILFNDALLKYKEEYFFIYSITGKELKVSHNYIATQKRYKELSNLIKKYQSNYLFTICNSNYLFLIKDNKILAFDYPYPDKELNLNKVIEEIISNPLLFHYYKPIEVICY